MSRKATHGQSTYFEPGSGNVFADLGLPEPEVALAKARVAVAVAQVVERCGFSQATTAKIVGLDELCLRELMRGRLSAFTHDRLVSCLADLEAASVLSAEADSVKL
jgi:predicted XRE-type DNA-binding protein